jgi:hypothetical protein
MKRPRTIAAMLLAGFLAFAPPGTLIACAALVVALFGYCSGSGDKAEPPPVETETQQQQATPSPTPSPTPAAER